MLEHFGDLDGLDEKSLDMLSSVLNKNNLEGFDYLEFKAAVHALQQDINMDVPTAYKSAFATASTMGLDKNKLLETTRYYLNLLKQEKTKVQQAAKKKLAEQVAEQETKQKRLLQEIAEGEAALKKLEAELAERRQSLKHKRQVLSKQIEQLEQARQKITHTEQKFIRTCHVLEQRIADDLEKIKQILS